MRIANLLGSGVDGLHGSIKGRTWYEGKDQTFQAWMLRNERREDRQM